MRQRPFRDPHHSASVPALVGAAAQRHNRCNDIKIHATSFQNSCNSVFGSPSTRRDWAILSWIPRRLAELKRPLPHGLVADDDATGREHLLDRAQTQWGSGNTARPTG